ncbi:MAG TPA: hypothetical protein VMG82_22990, partial [Candidatus Sulfotelmatobacter sp.]|nr:hypothetical protein [Candidatus Sulfotelmatobacter sp.]
FESVGAEVTVTFVEFADGTTFGRSQWGNQLPLQREKELGYMQKLIESYDQGGKTALAGALSAEAVRETDPTYLKLFALEMQDLLEHSGSDSVMQRLRGSVQYAIARMKSPSRPD